MYEDVPSWLKPFLREGAYSPNLQFVQDLVPQSRIEALLKFMILESMVTYQNFLDADSSNFLTLDLKKFLVSK